MRLPTNSDNKSSSVSARAFAECIVHLDDMHALAPGMLFHEKGQAMGNRKNIEAASRTLSIWDYDLYVN